MLQGTYFILVESIPQARAEKLYFHILRPVFG